MSKVARAISFNPYLSDDATHRSWDRRAAKVNENIRDAEVSFDRDVSYDGFFDPNDTSYLDKLSPESAHRALHEARMKEESGHDSLCDEACFVALHMRETASQEEAEEDSFGISIFDRDVVSAKNNKHSHMHTLVNKNDSNGNKNTTKNSLNKNSQNRVSKSNKRKLDEYEAFTDVLNSRLSESRVKDIEASEHTENTKSISNNAPVFRTRCLRIFNTNVRGFYSKKETIENICIKEEVDICVMTETHSVGNNFPEIKNFKTFFRNRKGRNCGGVAVLVKESLSKYVTKIAEGEQDNEWLALRFTNTSPSLVVIAYYGNQSGSFGGGGKASEDK